MKASEFINKYLKFFETKKHKIIPSASLIPQNDATVLFNTAGMQPLIPYLLGQKHPLGTRLANVQKCIRTVDFDNIGDNTHHTFFQMLGNWSLGDYFKKESIEFSYGFLVNELKIDKEKLAVTVYEGDKLVERDNESAELWKLQGISEDRIAYLGKDDNWWSAGDTGPCGPDTEIFYWKGNEKAPKKFDPTNNNWVEIWNNVFMTYNKKEDGSIELLENKNVDTGMGVERTFAILSGKESAYETDLFLPVIQKISEICKKNYLDNKKEFRVIADHIRASVFILADPLELKPSNTDRGYILRRLIRRAIVYGKKLNINEQFLETLAREVMSNYKELYPELVVEKTKQFILTELNKEELKFKATLEKGLKEFEKLSQRDITGKDAFLLFQSYGFPIEMTNELALEKGIKVDVKGFNDEFKKHQELSRVGAEQKFKGGLADTSGETIKLHTTAHILNEALRKLISKDIKQKGSNITPERLRFDFNFNRALTDDEKKALEDEVNRIISQKIAVNRDEMKLEDAFKSGAHGEFGTKYPDIVSVYTIGNYSKEICMGPHVSNTTELGKFKIIKEESSGAGIRRIKAVLE